MIQLDQTEFETLIRCQNCQQIYNLPIILPCGVSICQSCFQKLHEEPQDCKFCSTRHETNAKYPINQSVKLLVGIYKDAMDSKAGKGKNPDLKHLESIYSSVKKITHVDINSAPIESTTKAPKFERQTSIPTDPARKELLKKQAKEKYEVSKQNIEDKIRKVRGQVDSTVELIISGVVNQKKKLYKEIDGVRSELLKDLNEQYDNIEYDQSNINLDNLVLDSLGDKFQSPTIELDELTDQADKIVDRKLNKLNTNVMDALRRSDQTKKNLDISLVSDINSQVRTRSFDSSIKASSLMDKLRNLNDTKYARHRNLTALVDYENIVKKRFGLLGDDKMVVIIERYFGQVSFLYLYLVNMDYTILASNQINGIWGFHSYAVFNNHIVIGLRLRKELYKIILYNDQLEMLKETTFNCELKRIFMNSKEIILTTHEKTLKMAQHLAHVFNYELVEVSHFGQTKHPKKSSFVTGNILAISPDKIFTKQAEDMIILSRAGLKREKSFKTSFNAGESLALDSKENRLIVFRPPNDLELYDEEGILLIRNQLRHVEGIEFDEFCFNDTQNFCLINSKMNHFVVV